MMERLKSNVAEVKGRISAAAKRSGRDSDSIRLIAVTKYVDAAMTRALVEAGCRELGENRPQVLWEKAESLADLDVQWHLIGHLQRNKVKRTVGLTHLIHSVDSPRLLKSIAAAAGEAGCKVSVLLEVNVSGEAAKHGLAPEELGQILELAAGMEPVSVEGLMCMAGLDGDLDQARREFASLRELSQTHQKHAADNVDLKELSMGMSGDFEVAIEEGATLVRVGSLLFEGLV